MSEQGEQDVTEATIAREVEVERGMEGTYAILNENLHAYREVVDVDAGEPAFEVYGTQEEVETARTIIERTFQNTLEDLTEAQIMEGVERGDVTEADGEFALKSKREFELAKIRQEYANEASRELDDDEHER